MYIKQAISHMVGKGVNMAQGFIIVNKTKMEYFNSSMLPSNFKGLINSSIAGKVLLRLVCVFKNDAYKAYKNLNFYSRKYMGSWSGDEIEIMGDYQEEKELYEEVFVIGNNINLEVMAMLYDQEEDELNSIIDYATTSIKHFMHICEVALIPNCPQKIIFALESKFGSKWKDKYYTEKNNGHYWV